ncbi:NAD binding domain of 6-phosphogluconate dehydrogenase-domain-containing protein [Lasiosphaeria hispida]|uniref:NAD binding domain of 6-phosphogluconate dehydrogenase-domain-containing protein n=1 Tax=Lasiosphaeria hispida TaxID=260671 RepID=A0AAJ0HHZ7_9PEZI|nr:NAD binding domain of 6-phosphogluconate dehydrogenase-domain-containing protein [Lasiosphaeria hispida]
MAPRLLWIGLGNMGRGMVKNIAEKANLDQPLLLYNRTKQRSVDLSAELGPGKTEVIGSVAEGAAKADIIFIILANDKIVEDAIDEILRGDVQGKLIVECSTIHPDTTERLAKAVVAKGAEFVAAPVFGAPAMADAGQLVVVLAGPKSSIDRAKQYFKGVMARGEIDMSDEPYSKALTLKLVGNTFILNMVEQLAEGHVLAEKTGLGTKYLHQWVENIFPGPYAAYSERMLSGDYFQREYPLFAVDLARKDARHALNLAEAAGATLHNVETANAHLAKVREHVGELGDIAGIYGAVRKEAGLKFENK